MVIDIRKLNAQKKYTGEMQFDYSASDTLIDIPFVNFSTPVTVKFSYELYEDDSLEIKGTVSYTLTGQCSRCLQTATQKIVGDLDALFEPIAGGEDYSYKNGVIDLKQAVDEAIMASLPFILSCGNDCVGLTYSDEPENN